MTCKLPSRLCAELRVLRRRRQCRLQRGSTTTLQLTANLRPDGFGAAIQTLARVLDRARNCSLSERAPCSLIIRRGRARIAERSEPQSDRSWTACVLYVLASSDHDRLGIGRIARPLSESAAAKPQSLTFRRHPEVAAEGGPRRLAAEGVLVVRPPSSCPALGSGLRPARAQALCRASTSCDFASLKDVDGIRTRACPSSASVTAASRVNPTCRDRPGHDRETTKPPLRPAPCPSPRRAARPDASQCARHSR